MNRGIAIIRKYEGLKLRAYICPAGLNTIGYGATFYMNGYYNRSRGQAASLSGKVIR